MNHRDPRNHLLFHPSGDPVDPQPPRDELDSLLRDWHQDNAQRAAAGRDRLLASLKTSAEIEPQAESNRWSITVRRISLRAIVPLAAAAAVALVVLPFLRTGPAIAPMMDAGVSVALAKTGPSVVMAPDAGLLEAFDERGDALGPCVLKHTDVRAAVSGPFTRVTLTQKYHNPHKDKIEAVYTFPLSHRAAVDRMTMTIGDRVIVGEVKERSRAREAYEAARELGRTASLLEQERPNIFTQSVANIDPGADVDIEISYVEQLASKNGEFEFVFPTVVGPRYIPGDAHDPADQGRNPDRAAATPIPSGYQSRRGVVLLGPAVVNATGWKDDASKSTFDAAAMAASLASAQAIEPLPAATADVRTEAADSDSGLRSASHPTLYQFEVEYADGARERGHVDVNGVGDVGGRQFCMALPLPVPGAPFANSTGQVPDANRITPMPVRPPTRAGSDLSITVTIDTGGPGLTDVESPLHQTTRQDTTLRHDGLASRCTVTLTNTATIPNRDFVLKWRQAAMQVADAVFTSRTEQGDFFALMLQPPNRVEDAMAIPRELIFVLDTSGSMSGAPIEQSKLVAKQMIEGMRDTDKLNVITFSGDTRVLWSEPRPGTDENRAEALAFFESRPGRGGTEMMSAIEAALAPTPAALGPGELTVDALSVTPADGREVTVRIRDEDLDSTGLTKDSVLTDGRIVFNSDGDTPLTARIENLKLPRTYLREANNHLTDDTDLSLIVRGIWMTVNDERVFVARSAVLADAPAIKPVRIVVFLTDGQVGNDLAIIDAVRRHRGTTRVFAFGIGNSVNRYLLDGIAHAGNGAAEYVLLSDSGRAVAAERAAARLADLSRTPILTHISAEFSPGLSVADFEPALDAIPDLFDAQPVTLLGRFTQPGDGSVTLRGMTAAGPWERTIPIRLAPNALADGPGVVANLWARARIDSLLGGHLADLQQERTPPDLKAKVVSIGESFSLLSPFTSFVAVDHRRITIDGQPRLVPIPIELPDRTDWDGFFGPELRDGSAAQSGGSETAPEPEAKKADKAKDDAASVSKRRGGAASAKDGPARSDDLSAISAATPAGSAAAPKPGGLRARRAEGAGTAVDQEERMKVTAEPEQFSKLARDLAGQRPASARAGVDAASIESSAHRERQPLPQDKAAEAFYDSVANTLAAAEARGQLPPDRLAAVAGANYIVQNAQAGQYAAASRASELFQSRYPGDPLLNEAANLVSNVDHGEQQAGAKERDNAEPTDARKDSARSRAEGAKRTGSSPSTGGRWRKSEAAQKPAETVAAAPTSTDLQSLANRAEQAAERERLLVRRLDPRLYELLPAPTSNQQRAAGGFERRNQQTVQNTQSMGRDRSGRQIAQSGPELLVSVLVESLDDATVESLKLCGLNVQSRIDGASTVVGRVSLAKLVSLALCQGVRRIEPVME